ncbi:hypothetical protein [Pseudofrankia saprophytica]|uniref:hypothetical protein n=1 Tax=Pseudofrankia saprophytica TaxID=298655 RepID=UPI0018E2C8AC|nr:hypothetical protein [Pseudofrankia saprophytica]
MIPDASFAQIGASDRPVAPHRLMVFAGVVTLALNIADPLIQATTARPYSTPSAPSS